MNILDFNWVKELVAEIFNGSYMSSNESYAE
jgi:hypothetical protein